jgi:hypothetical protein
VQDLPPKFVDDQGKVKVMVNGVGAVVSEEWLLMS